MKTKTVFAASLLLTGAAFAEATTVDSSYILGVMPLQVSGKEVIINIPWIESGKLDNAVAVSNLVKTAGLAVGDSLLWYDTSSSGYQGWHIESDNGTNRWVASTTVNMSGESKTVSAGSVELRRGQALILSRASSDATTIYIIGQDGSGVETSAVTISAGTTASPSYTLFAPPSVSVQAVNSINWNITDPTTVANDYILLSDGSQLRYRESTSGSGSYAWIKYSYGVNGALIKDTAPTIPAGTGAWYVSKGGAPTINF